MKEQNGPPETRSCDLESLLSAVRDASGEEAGVRGELIRRLAESIPERALGAVLDELTSEQARRRSQHYEATLLDARAAAARGDLPAAQVEAETACHIDPVRWEAHQLLGEIHERAGNSAEALLRYVTAVHLGWESEDAIQALKRLAPAA